MIKFFLIAMILLITAFNSFSQIKKGTRMAGATVGTVFYNSGKSAYSYPPPTTGYVSNSKSYGVNLSPSMGWFISHNTAIGASLNFAVSNSKITDVSDATGNTFNKDNSNRFNMGLGGFVRNYFKTDGSLLPFGQFNINFGTGSTKIDGFNFIGNDKYSYTGKSSGDNFLNTGVSLGFTKMLNSYLGLDFFVGYTYSSFKSSFDKTTQVDENNDGTINSRLENKPTQQFTNQGAVAGVSFQIFLDKK